MEFDDDRDVEKGHICKTPKDEQDIRTDAYIDRMYDGTDYPHDLRLTRPKESNIE